MSLWYDKKGKSYATKGNSFWVKAYAEHLVASLKDAISARLNRHIAGTEGQHKAETVMYDETTSVKEAIQQNTNLGFSVREELQNAAIDLKAQIEEQSATLDARFQEETANLSARLQEETANLSAQLQEETSNLNTRLQEETTARETGLSQKVDKEEGKGLSSCDFTLAEKDKLSRMESIVVFEKQFLKEDWVDGVLQIPYEEHQKQNPVVSVFCHRYDYEVYEAEGICQDSLCDGSVMVYPIHPETKKEVAFSSWLTPYAGTVSSENYCTKCGISYVSQPHLYSVKNVEIFCPVAMDEEKNITLQSDIAFSGKVVMK